MIKCLETVLLYISESYQEPLLRKAIKFLFFSAECRMKKRAEVIVESSLSSALYGKRCGWERVYCV